MIVADDAGIDPNIDKVLLDLINRKKIDAISIMVINTQNYINKEIITTSADKHLHVSLSFGKPKKSFYWKKVGLVDKNGAIALTFFKMLLIEMLPNEVRYKKIIKKVIKKEIEEQKATFKRIYGSFSVVDCHQHMQVFPIIWNSLVNTKAKEILRWPEESDKTWVVFKRIFKRPLGTIKSLTLKIIIKAKRNEYIQTDEKVYISGLSTIKYEKITPELIFVCHPGPSIKLELQDSKMEEFIGSKERIREYERLMR